MPELSCWGLRGPVQSCRLQRTWYTRLCGADNCETEERGDITTLEFRRDGCLGRQWHHNPDSSEWTTTYEYDGTGRLISTRTENALGIIHIQLYEYDAVGRLVRKIARSTDSGDRIAESYEYDAGGRKINTLSTLTWRLSVRIHTMLGALRALTPATQRQGPPQ